jgi:putative ABC transport system ATP-binding protein
MSSTLFEITDLVCAYSRGRDVLKIEHLTIPANKLIVLIGISGSGKSTFLETIGLMNNTIKQGEVLFYPVSGQKSVSFKDLWRKENRDKISKIRRDFFSFIFQNTNLMPNFSAHENACLSQLIQGIPKETAMHQVRKTMLEMGLGSIEEWKSAVELSGGQRQRLAFVRAITPNFTVLFGDEPTGNLDEFNSRELMHKLRNNLISHHRSAIIVSHNIALSTEFADQLIILSNPADENSCTTIPVQNIFNKSSDGQWFDHINNPVTNINQHIEEVLRGNPQGNQEN